MISLEVMPKSRSPLSRASVRPDSTVSNEIPRSVCPCGSKKISTCVTFCGSDLLQVGKCEIEKILPDAQHGHSCVVKVKKILQRGKPIGVSYGLHASVGQHDIVPFGEPHHHLGFQRALDMKVQFCLRHCGDEAVKARLIDRIDPCGHGHAVAYPIARLNAKRACTAAKFFCMASGRNRPLSKPLRGR